MHKPLPLGGGPTRGHQHGRPQVRIPSIWISEKGDIGRSAGASLGAVLKYSTGQRGHDGAQLTPNTRYQDHGKSQSLSNPTLFQDHDGFRNASFQDFP